MARNTWSKLISRDYDFYYLLKLEQLKLRRMARYMKKHSLAESAPFDVRDMELCDRLITIINEEDAAYNAHLKDCAETFKTGEALTEYVYVNTRNERRFFRKTPIKDNMNDPEPYQGESGRNFRDVNRKMVLRRLKAMHLYNLVREYRMFGWWY